MNPIEFESIFCADARRVLRPAQTKEPLLPSTTYWIGGLPQEVRPRSLLRKFARIANRLAELWNEPARCAPYLADFRNVGCDSREGFPPDVATEIDALTVYYQTLHTSGRSWQ